MKRLCVMVIYDPEGIVDEYLLFLVQSLREVTNCIIGIINGKLENKDDIKDKFDSIIVRNNVGYDAGAFKDFFVENIKGLSRWDEIVLINDSSFGPFFEWNMIFSVMDNKQVDFWGLSRREACFDKNGYFQPEHLQSYFLVFRKDLFTSDAFRYYWESMPYPDGRDESIREFELTLTEFFAGRGYSYTSWLDENGGSDFAKGDNPTTFYYSDIIFQYNFPLLKRGAYNLFRHVDYSNCLKKLKAQYGYKSDMVTSNIRRLYEKGFLTDDYGGFFNIKKFVMSKKRVFFFGNGRIARKLESLFQYYGWKISGYVVSEPLTTGEIAVDEFEMTEEDGIIVALGYKNIENLNDDYFCSFKKESMLFP